MKNGGAAAGTAALIGAMFSRSPCDDSAALEAALAGVTDFFASSFQARREPDAARFLASLRAGGGNGSCWYIGQRGTGTAAQAALFNGFQAHLLDYDDVHADARGHPSAVILPALLSAAAPETGGRRFLDAYITGVELMARLGDACGNAAYARGFHNTAVLGAVAAAGAVSCLKNAPEEAAAAFALAATQASGLRLVFGTAAKPLNAGLAAEAAVRASAWAPLGWARGLDFLGPALGFPAVFGGGGAGAGGAFSTAGWGEPYRIVSPGLWFKDYAFCSAGAFVSDAARSLRAARAFNAENIRAVEIAFSPGGDAALIHTSPRTGLEGKFSAEYIASLALLGEPAGFAQFSGAPIAAGAARLMEKTRRARQTAPDGGRFARVTVTLESGEVFSALTAHPEGSPQNPYPPERLYRKLERACGDAAAAAAFHEEVLRLPRAENLGALIAAGKKIR